jgi:large subunit ribosomal protein L23
MFSPYDSIKTLLHSEKGARLEANGCYLFLVSPDATKIEIARAITKIYKVKVAAVNTVNVRGKMKRVRTQIGKKPDWKKAYVRLAAGQKIDISK